MKQAVQENLDFMAACEKEAPQMLFDGNAEIGRHYSPRPLGFWDAGAAADIIVADYDPLTPINPGNLNGHILFGLTGRSIVTTIVNGKILMQDRVLTGLDEHEVFAKCREHAQNRINKS